MLELPLAVTFALALGALLDSRRNRAKMKQFRRCDNSHCIAMVDRRIGELSRELPKAPDGKRRNLSESDVRTQKDTQLADIGISKQRASEAEHIAAVETQALAKLEDLRAMIELREQVKQYQSTRPAARKVYREKTN
jgi:hypothetical protein